jgi:hypothetical protein
LKMKDFGSNSRQGIEPKEVSEGWEHRIHVEDPRG